MKYAIALIVAGLVLLFYGAARADWQIQEWDGKQWAPAMTPRGHYTKINIEKSACELDLANLRMLKPSITQLECRRVK